jgi:preprotein translocase subunit SecA
VFEDCDLAGLQTQAAQLWPLAADLARLNLATADREEIARVLTEDALAAYDRRTDELGPELMRYLERQILLQIIDYRWREHLYEMDYLREGIHLRGFAQIDPLVAYKNEGFTMFRELMSSIWEEFARVIYHVQVNVEPAEAEEMFEPVPGPQELEYQGGGPDQPSAIRQAAGAAAAGAAAGGGAGASEGIPGDGGGDGASAATARLGAEGTRVKTEREKIGRNDPCWCGSGKKYKKCHGA